MTIRGALLAVMAASLLSACMSLGLGGDTPAQTQYLLNDAAAAATPRRSEPVVAALLIQPISSDAAADTVPSRIHGGPTSSPTTSSPPGPSVRCARFPACCNSAWKRAAWQARWA